MPRVVATLFCLIRGHVYALVIDDVQLSSGTYFGVTRSHQECRRCGHRSY